ncbi:MAG: DUF3566 domain-containing protein [Acidimicrobiia bacterium]|nr:DUF3566 domain-containing protein [Acidimicrobiia bacterium]
MASVRRVRRIIRKIDPWTVLKVSFLFYAVVALGLVLGSVIFWTFVSAAGYPDSIESFLAGISIWDAGESPLVPETEFLFRLTVFMTVAWTVLMTGLTTLAAVMYNLISDVVGGLELVVLEETLNVPAPVANQRPVRQVQSWQTPAPPVKADRPASGEVDQVDLPTQVHPQVGSSTGGQGT